MGAIQQPTIAMGPYKAEVRRESFYLSAASGSGATRIDRHTLTMPARHAAHWLAALDQVRGHRTWRTWLATSPAVAADPERAVDGFTVVAGPDDGQVTVHSPWPVYADGADGSDPSLEVEYEDVEGLRAQLGALSPAPSGV